MKKKVYSPMGQFDMSLNFKPRLYCPSARDDGG